MSQAKTKAAAKLFNWLVHPRASTALCYFAGFLVQRIAFLMLVPILVIRFTAEEFSRYGLLQSVLLLAPAVLTLRVHTALGRLIYDTQLFQRTVLLSSSLVGGLVPVILFTIIMCLVNFSNALPDPVTKNQLGLVLALGAILVSRVIVEFGSILYRAEGDGRRFLLLALLDGGMIALVGLWAAFSNTATYESLVLGIALASGVTTFLSLAMLRSEIPVWKPEWPVIQACLRYSWPTSVHFIGWWFCSQSARWTGISKLGLTTMAGFSLMLVMINVISLVTRTVFEVDRPRIGQLFSQSRLAEGDRVLSGNRQHAVLVALGLGLSLILVYQILGKYLSENYSLSVPMLLLATVYLVLDAFALKSTNLLLALKKSRALMIASIFGGATALLSAGPLCDALGLVGLCLSLALAALVQALASEWASRRQLRISLGSTAIIR